ncbi:MAG: DUF58 domain-containing protein [Deltaproteobacteria bacterium]|nr:DUF58 domain-containing protein [Deltaproteobacteria bacterium]
MIPSLAARGKLVLASSIMVLLVGALHGLPPIVALGGVALSALASAYLAFYPTAVLLRRKKIELSWWAPPGDQPGGALAADRPFALHVAFRNHGARSLRVLSTRVLAGSALDVEPVATATVKAGTQVEVATAVRPMAAGYHVIHGAVLVLGDALGLFEVQAYFPNPIAVKVFPRALPARARAIRPQAGTPHEQVGQHQVRRRGQAGELRELRDHAHGDPFKMIAWKATAKRGRLMVRDLETEIVATHALVVDTGARMRGGAVGRAPLDWALDTASAMARASLERGDRVGLVAFDTRPHVELKPGAGRHHWLQLVDRLLDAQTVVDEDLTDITPSELVATVARYLSHQEAYDTRLRTPPALEDPRWNHIQAGPDGQLYDLGAMNQMITKLLETMGGRAGKTLAPPWWWQRVHVGADTDPQLAPLRLFCRLRGIELPYRQIGDHGARAAGFAAALERAVAFGRPDAVVIVSNLHGLGDDEPAVTRALARVKRGAGQVVALVPPAHRFAPPAETRRGMRVRAAFARDGEVGLAIARRLLARHGVHVIEAGPGDAPASLLGRLRGGRRVA